MSIAAATRSVVAAPARLPSYFWPPGVEPKRDHTDFLAFQNGLLDIRRLLAGEPHCMQSLTPLWFSNICMDYPFDPLADCPRWKNVLTQNLEGDGQRIALLQEWAGYLILPDTAQQKFIILEGEGANGKSVYCAVINAMLGDEATSHIPLELFGVRFQLSNTLGKLVNIAADCGDLDRVAEGHLKAFTSGNRMSFELKGIQEQICVEPTARLMLACNNRPRFSDRSPALWRRMLDVPFNYSVPEAHQILGMDKPAWWRNSGELPGIFNWAVQGLDRLRKQKRFTIPDICRDALADYRTEVNPAKAFLEETCFVEPAAETDSTSLYHTYKEWCSSGGYRPLGERQFGKEVRRAFPKTEIFRPRAGNLSARPRRYRGISVQEGDFQ